MTEPDNIIKYKHTGNCETKQTRVLNGKFAPKGFLFFVVTIKKNKHIYSNSIKVDCKGKTDELVLELYERLYLNILKKYKL